MRRRRRSLVGGGALIALMLAACAAWADPMPPPAPVRLTLDIEWTTPALPALPDGSAPLPPPIDLEVPAGRVIEVAGQPGDPPPSAAEIARGRWRIDATREGGVRARIEAPLAANLIVRAGAHATAFSLAGLTQAAQQSLPGAPVSLRVSRVAWDSLEVDLPGGDGTVAPGEVVPVRVGFNVLTPEPSDGIVRLIAALRPVAGGAPVWQCDQSHVVGSDQPAPVPAITLNLAAPEREGTYELELDAFWEPAVATEGSRLGRLIRRRRTAGAGPTQASRRVTLAVVGPAPTPATRPEPAPATVVDELDPARLRGSRASATGRAPAPLPGRAAWPVPAEALLQNAFPDRLRGLIGGGSGLDVLPGADASGLAWAATPLIVPNPGRAHRLVVSITEGDPAALGVALIEPVGDDAPARRVLDAAGSGPIVGAGAEPVRCAWPIWPDAGAPTLVLVNRGPTPIRLGSVKVEELPDGPPPAPGIEPDGAASRRLGLVLSRAGDLEPFAVGADPADPVRLGRRIAAYLASCGATAAVLPARLADRPTRRRLDGQAAEDSTGPDRLALVVRLLDQANLAALVELDCSGPLPGLPPPETAAALDRGLVRLDGQGQPDGPAYNALHPEVRAALVGHATAAIAARSTHPNLLGLLIRLGPGPTLPGGPDTGLDDATYERFVAAMVDPVAAERVPGRGTTDPNRYAARRQYLAGPGRAPWLAWRSQQTGALYGELARAMTSAAPGALLAVATPGLDDGPAGREARRGDLAGESPLRAWEALGLDLARWPAAAADVLVLRGLDTGPDPLGRELATHAELDAALRGRPARGLIWSGSEPEPSGLVLTTAPLGPRDEPLGHAVAVLDARWVLLAPTAVVGREAEVARFARVLRALPAAEPAARPLAPETGVAARTWAVGGKTVLGLANDTPYTMRVEAVLRGAEGAAVDDLGRGQHLEPRPAGGGRSLVVDLPPFGVAAVRVAKPDVAAGPVNLFPPTEVLEAQFRQLTAQLDRLARGGGATGPPNPGFERAAPGRGPLVTQVGGATVPAWSSTGPAALALDPTAPRGGATSLRLEASGPAAAAVGPRFVPPGGTELELRAWLRADRVGARVRIWVEGEAAGQPIVRRAEVAARADWAEQRVRVAGLPEPGLDRLRLRFELTEPGTLWVDDLTVTGPKASEHDLRAQRVLIRALQAFRERRMADFARLADSPRVRPDTPEPSPTAAALRTGRTTDLPPGRRLR